MDYTYSLSTQRYRDSAGRFVSAGALNRAVDHVIRGASARMQAMSAGLQDGSMSLPAWQEAIAREMKLLHVGAAAVGRGGWKQMSQSDWGWTGHELRTHYAFLRGFSNDIATGRQPLDGRLLARTAMYAEAARGTFQEMRRRMAQQIGEQQELNLLGAADRHCASCVACTAAGWVPIGTLRRIGGRSCLSRCKCSMTYRQIPVETMAA